MVYQTWRENVIDQTMGSSEPWPVGPPGGSGWKCTQGCFMQLNDTMTSNTYRDLATYINGLLNQTQCSLPNCAINDAIIRGIKIVTGSDEPHTTTYTNNIRISSSNYDWRWRFTSTPTEVPTESPSQISTIPPTASVTTSPYPSTPTSQPTPSFQFYPTSSPTNVNTYYPTAGPSQVRSPSSRPPTN